MRFISLRYYAFIFNSNVVAVESVRSKLHVPDSANLAKSKGTDVISKFSHDNRHKEANGKMSAFDG